MVLFDTRLFRRFFETKSASLYIDKIVNLLVKRRTDEVTEDIDDELRGNAGTYFERIGTYDGLSSIYLVPKTGSTIDYWVSEYPDFNITKLWLYFDHTNFNYSGGIGYVRDMSYFDRHAKMLDDYCMASGGSGLVLPWRPDLMPSIVTIPNGVNQPYSVPDTADLQVSTTDFSLIGVVYPKSYAETEVTRNLNVLQFDGVNNYVDCGNQASLWSQSLTKFSFSFWIFPTKDGVGGTNLNIVNHNGTTAQGFRCYLPNAANRIDFNVKDALNGDHGAFSASLVINTWNHVVCTYDNTLGSANVKIYLNGVLGGTTGNLTEAVNLSAILTLADSSNDFKGNMKDFKWWTTVPLTQTDVTNLYNGRDELVTIPNYHLEMDEGTGNPKDTIAELTATLTNGTAWVKEKYPCVSFDGNNDYIDLGKRFDLWNKKQTKFSFSIWVLFRNITTDQYSAVFGLSPDSACELSLYTNTDIPNTLIAEFTTDDYGTNYASVFGTIQTGKWHHVVVTYDKSLSINRLKIYIDAVVGTTDLQGTDMTLDNKTDNAYLGMYHPADTPYALDGHLTDFRWWNNRTLTQAEITTLLNGTEDDTLKPDYQLSLNEGTGKPLDQISLNVKGTPYKGIMNGAIWRTDIFASFKTKVKAICGKADDASNKYLLYMDENGLGRLKCKILKGGTEFVKEASTLLSLNTWYWIMVTWKASTNTLKIYVNGTDVTQASTSNVEFTKSTVSKDLWIVTKNALKGFFYTGIYLFGFVRKEWSSTEVTDLFSNKATYSSSISGSQVAWVDYSIPQ